MIFWGLGWNGSLFLPRTSGLLQSGRDVVLYVFGLFQRERMSDFYETLRTVLLQDERLVAQDGTLLRNYAFELGEKADKKLLQLLLENRAIKKHFFQKVGDIMVFDKRKFCWVVNNRQFLPDSYTRFANKIGFVDDRDKLISQTENVQLAFPYKDCILEGGQTKDDQKRNEIFWNELLSPDECDWLLEPKVLCNAKIFPKQSRKQSPQREQGILIKGNNLFALASLVKIYEGKIKLIYIDPPYNTGTDSFLYNDRFNHAAWLTFMKNRLVLAKRLLADNGSIFVHCDDNEQAYLKVLMDEIFQRENFISTLVIKGGSGRQDSANFAKTHEFIITYAKKIDSFSLNKKIVNGALGYTKVDENGRKYKTQLLRKWGSNDRRLDRPKLYFPVDFNGETFYPSTDTGDGCWRWTLAKITRAINSGIIESGTTRDGKRELYQRLYYDDNNLKTVTYASILEENLEDSYSGKGSREISKLFGSKVFSNPKPELLMQQILEMVTEENDLILDFHAGSGTTLAVAHKMGRRWIGVEQMAYVESVTVERLDKVLEGEQGGISKAVGWQGGGAFIYCELAVRNVTFVDRIGKAKTAAELSALWKEIQKVDAYDYRIDIDVAEDFEALSLADKKRFLIEVLDKEHLYVNLSDIDDEDFKISEADKKFTREFYGV